MNKKREVTQEMIEKYENYLSGRAAAYQSDIDLRQKHLKKILEKKEKLESSLRSDLREGVAAVFKAVGLENSKKLKIEKKPSSIMQQLIDQGFPDKIKKIPEETKNEETKPEGWDW